MHTHANRSILIFNLIVAQVQVLPGFSMRVTSSKGNKFKDPQMQVKAVHLDCEFLKFDRTLVSGPLPEMWGLREPISVETKALLLPLTKREE